MNNHKKYLSLPERIQLIKDIQKGTYIVKQKTGKIIKKLNKRLYTSHCKIIDILEKLADIKEIGQGSYGKALRICMPKNECNNKDIIPTFALAYSIKEVIFQNIGTYNNLIENPDRYENAEIRMLQLLSTFVFSGATPHLNLPIMSFICKPSPHLSKNNENDRYGGLNTTRYIISELADYGNMYGYVSGKLKLWKHNELVWKVLFFQILSTLSVIHRYYPNFLHNDLKPDNILVRSTTQGNQGYKNNYYEYNVDGTIYYIPDVGFQLLLWDFDFACIAGTIDNDKIITMIDEEDANLVCHRNQYYDIHMCFGQINRFWGDMMPEEVSNWLHNYLLTDQIPSSDKDERILESIELTTPSQLLDNDFFDQFKTSPYGDLIEKYTGELDPKIRFDFGEKTNRYTDPLTCQYQTYMFFDPKNATQEEAQDLRNRYKCELASNSKFYIANISEKQIDKMKKWLLDIINSYDVKNNISKTESKLIIGTAIELFKQFIDRHNITSKYLYPILSVCVIYASFYHILAYVSPFNNFKFWYSQRKMENLTNGELEDIYKQFCGFIAKYIENN